MKIDVASGVVEVDIGSDGEENSDFVIAATAMIEDGVFEHINRKSQSERIKNAVDQGNLYVARTTVNVGLRYGVQSNNGHKHSDTLEKIKILVIQDGHPTPSVIQDAINKTTGATFVRCRIDKVEKVVGY